MVAPSASAAAAVPRVVQIAVDLIRPGRLQARRRFDADALAELAQSIRELGVVQPVVVRGDARGYELLAGERRWRAAQLAGLHELPALVRNDLAEDEAEILGLIENLQREALSPMETAEGMRALGDRYRLTHEALGARIGKSRAYVTNYLRLLSLHVEVRSWIDQGELSLGHAKVLAGLPEAQQREWGARAMHERWSVRVLERRAGARSAAKSVRSGAFDVKRLQRALSEQLGYPAELTTRGDGGGELRLRFHSLDELDGLLARIGFDDTAL